MLRPNPDPPAVPVPAGPALAPHVTVLKEAMGRGKSRGEGSEERRRPVGRLAPEVVRWVGPYGVRRGYKRGGRSQTRRATLGLILTQAFRKPSAVQAPSVCEIRAVTVVRELARFPRGSGLFGAPKPLPGNSRQNNVAVRAVSHAPRRAARDTCSRKSVLPVRCVLVSRGAGLSRPCIV